MPLHAELADFLELVELGRSRGNLRAMHEMTVEQARLAFTRSSPALESDPATLPCVRDVAVPARDGVSLNLRLYAARPFPFAEPLPVLLFLHGGGYVIGDLDSHDALCRDLAHRSGWAVLAVDYRRAPEHKFPTALNDVLDAIHWLAAQGGEFGVNPGRLVVAGDSVGGTLATVLATLAVREPDAMPLRPLLQILIYPVTDAVGCYPSRRRFAEGYLLETASLEWFYQHYQADAASRADWRFSPMHSPPTAGMAPALLLIGEYDPLLDETSAYAEKLRAADVDADLRIAPGLTHDFIRMADLLPETALYRQHIADTLKSLR